MKITIDKEIEKMIKAYEYVSTKRGSIIDLAITIENTLEDIITWCFYPSKYSSNKKISELLNEDGIVLKSLLLRRIEFREKINILKDVISARNPDTVENNEALINTIVRELDQVRKFRNLLVHSESDISREFLSSLHYSDSEITDKFQVVEYKKGKVEKHLINNRKYLSEVIIMFKVIFRLWELFALLNDDTEEANNNEELVILLTSRVNSPLTP